MQVEIILESKLLWVLYNL